jgi:hypothetical protein
MEDSNFNQNENILFDLLDNRSFDELTADEQVFVLQFMSKDEYYLRREVIAQSKNAFKSDVVVLPKVLNFLPDKKAVSHKREIAMYRLLLSAAAIVILFLLVVPYLKGSEIVQSENKIVQHDTVTIEKEIHDTVYLEKRVTQFVKEKVYVQAPTYENCSPEELRLLETQPVRPVSLENVLTEKNGKAISQDETKFLVTDLNVVSDVIGR